MNEKKLDVLKIAPIINNRTFQVIVETGQKQYQFTMTVEIDSLCNQPLQIIQGDDQFCTFFQWNKDLAATIYELVASIYNQESLDFPISLGDFEPEKSSDLMLKVNPV